MAKVVKTLQFKIERRRFVGGHRETNTAVFDVTADFHNLQYDPTTKQLSIATPAAAMMKSNDGIEMTTSEDGNNLIIPIDTPTTVLFADGNDTVKDVVNYTFIKHDDGQPTICSKMTVSMGLYYPYINIDPTKNVVSVSTPTGCRLEEPNPGKLAFKRGSNGTTQNLDLSKAQSPITIVLDKTTE